MTGSVGRSSTAVASGVELDLRNIFDGRADSDPGLRPLSTCSPCSRAWRRKAKASGAEWRRCSYTVPILRKKGRRLIVGGMWAKRGWMRVPDWAAMLYRHCAGTWLVVNPKLLRPHGSTRPGGVAWRAGGMGSRPAPVRANGCHVAEAPLPSTAPRDAHHVTAMLKSSQPAHLAPSSAE